MQISPLKNPNFENPSRNLSNRTKVKIQKKKICGYPPKKILFRVCSVTAEMFEHRNSGENRRKRSEIFFANLRRAYKDLIQVKKNSKLSHACVPLTSQERETKTTIFSVSFALDNNAKLIAFCSVTLSGFLTQVLINLKYLDQGDRWCMQQQ